MVGRREAMTLRGASMTLQEFLESTYIPEHQLAPESIRQLRIAIGHFEQFAGQRDLTTLRHTILNEWLQANPRRWSPKTARNKLGAVLSVWNYAYAIEATETAPDTRRIRRIPWHRQSPDAWTIDDLRSIVEASQAYRRYLPSGIRICDLFAAFVWVGFYSALRPQDLFRLRVDQLSDRGEWVEQQKKHRKELLVQVPAWVIGFLRDRWPPDALLVWSWGMSSVSFYDWWWKILGDAGLRTTRRDGPQKLRRTAVSYGEAAKAGYGAMLAGHSPGSRVTWESYCDPRVVHGAREILLPDLRPETEQPRVLSTG